MPFDRQRKLVFLHIPKTAGSSIEQALDLFGPWQEENLQTGFGLIQSRDLLARNLSSNFLQHLTLAELEDLFPEILDQAKLFTVVRDPWQRLLSSYRNPDPDLVAYYRWRTQDINQLSLQYIDVARWLPPPCVPNWMRVSQPRAFPIHVADLPSGTVAGTRTLAKSTCQAPHPVGAPQSSTQAVTGSCRS